MPTAVDRRREPSLGGAAIQGRTAGFGLVAPSFLIAKASRNDDIG